MDAQLQALLDNLVKSQFADLKGSWANLHLILSEKVVNEFLAKALATQKKDYPWLGMVNAAHIKGSIVVEIKLQV
jgi:hypothetical protein